MSTRRVEGFRDDRPWLRVNPSIRSFILGEVERQRWFIGTPDYKRRVEWMTDAWIWAMEKSEQRPTVEDILFVAGRIEPHENRDGYRRMGVQVGDRTCPSPNDVPGLVERLWQNIDDVCPVEGKRHFPGDYPTADDFYLEFEMIHPFGDGNGRTGKILHNWLLGTLDKPVLVADYFGGGNP